MLLPLFHLIGCGGVFLALTLISDKYAIGYFHQGFFVCFLFFGGWWFFVCLFLLEVFWGFFGGKGWFLFRIHCSETNTKLNEIVSDQVLHVLYILNQMTGFTSAGACNRKALHCYQPCGHRKRRLGRSFRTVSPLCITHFILRDEYETKWKYNVESLPLQMKLIFKGYSWLSA